MCDSIGPRKWALLEECKIHNYDSTAIAFLHNHVSKEAAMKYVARGLPVAPLSKIYHGLLKCLQDDNSRPFTTMQRQQLFSSAACRVLATQIHQVMPSLNNIRVAQLADPHINDLHTFHRTGKKKEVTSLYSREAPFTVLHDGVIFYRTLVGDDENLAQAIILPESLRTQVLQALHDAPTFCHPGETATLTICRMRVYWKTMVKDIRKYVLDCEACKRKRAAVKKHAGHPVSHFYNVPMEVIGIDLIGELPACDGDKWILHILCWATGFNYCVTLPDKRKSTVAEALHRYFLIFGEPAKAIVSDNGFEFINSVFEELVKGWGCNHVRTSVYNPQGNSRTERRHRDYNQILKTVVNKYGDNWKMGAYMATFTLNTRPHHSSSSCAFQQLLGYTPRVPQERGTEAMEGLNMAQLDKSFLSAPQIGAYLQRAREIAQHDVKLAAKEQLQRNQWRDLQTSYEVKYNTGDLCLVSRPVLGNRIKGTATRLRYQHIGPFEVIEARGSSSYLLKKLGTNTTSAHHVRNMSPYLTKEAYETEVVKPALEDAAANAATGAKAIIPKVGDFLLYTGHGSTDRPWYLVKVTAYFQDDEHVNFHYYNTRRKAKLPLVGHRPVWIKPNKPEVQAMLQPDGYTADIQGDSLDQFCQMKMPVATQMKNGVPDALRVTRTDVDKATGLRKLPTLAVAKRHATGAQKFPAPGALRLLTAVSLASTAKASPLSTWGGGGAVSTHDRRRGRQHVHEHFHVGNGVGRHRPHLTQITTPPSSASDVASTRGGNVDRHPRRGAFGPVRLLRLRADHGSGHPGSRRGRTGRIQLLHDATGSSRGKRHDWLIAPHCRPRARTRRRQMGDPTC